MPPLNHTYGPTCRLSRNVNISGSKGDDDIPVLIAQYFYSSPLPIDDPLTAIPTPSSTESKPSKHSPRPFSAYDNNALEEAWIGLASDQDRKHSRKFKNSSLKPLTKLQADTRSAVVSELAAKHIKKHTNNDANKQGRNDSSHMLKLQGDGAKSDLGECSECHKPLGLCDSSSTKVGCTACTTPSTKRPKRGVSPSTRAKSTLFKTPNLAVIDSAPAQLVEDSIAKTPRSIATNNSMNDTDEVRKKEDDDLNPYNLHFDDPHHVSIDLDPPLCCSELEDDVKAKQGKDADGALEERESKEGLIQEVMVEAKQQKSGSSGKAKAERKDVQYISKTRSVGPGAPSESISEVRKGLKDSMQKGRQSKEHKASEKYQQSKDHKEFSEQEEANHSQPADLDSKKGLLSVPGSSDAGTTGFPFKRALSRKLVPQSTSRSPSLSPSSRGDDEDFLDDDPEDLGGGSPKKGFGSAETVHVHRYKTHKDKLEHANVPVGISRLHLVKMPALQMMPIYWSPVHDIAAVTRGTWFYKETMYPVEPAVANQLEMGYRELRPWSQTWSDELNSAIEVGAAGEEKISHRLWLKDDDKNSDRKSGSQQTFMATDPFCAARCFHGEVAAVGTVDPSHPDEKTSQTAEITKRFPNCQVIYKDSQSAFILKPSLQPSEYYGRRPLAKIKKGMTIGIPVTRGYDWKAWENLHPSKKSTTALKAEAAAPVTGNADAGKRTVCGACLKQEERPKVTDLVLVIHGIGQKLSERVESFHFTHAINAFRRSVNVELGNEAVGKVLRKDLGGVMVLPVNWRSNLSFEDGGPMKDGDKSKDTFASDFTLKDITPDTIPAVRNLISDVMLDIPFYMSHHKPKIIEALITEANRVYRLWCQNNPDFNGDGRVHIIAHSLGSAMALDVLSKQPTKVPVVDLRKKMCTKYFEFDTKNLFFAGSPAGFFLLLEKGQLIPRKGRNKPGSEPGDDDGKDITAEVGNFGCLAVDNLYNIMHYNDPIAYRLNAAVDSLYALTLKNAQVPSSTTGWFEAIGNAMKSMKPGAVPATELGVGEVVKPPVARLPSQLEMEVHDFTREEKAEKKFYLLNDNGQIDYFLSSGGGPLEIQYLNMLSAHSSYWINPDFIRMLVTEIGRKPGRSSTLPNMKAVKAVKAGHK